MESKKQNISKDGDGTPETDLRRPAGASVHGMRRHELLFCITAFFASGAGLGIVLSGAAMSPSMLLQAVKPLAPLSVFGCIIGIGFLLATSSHRKEAMKHEAELEKALARARTAERTRSMFFNIVSHDIRSPLNAILGYCELLQTGIKTKAERDEALDSIRASGTTLLQLVNDVLDLAKMDAGKMTLSPEPVLLSRLASDVFASFRLAAAGKGVELVSKTAGVPALLLDAHRFRQILFNLVGNAVKFTNRGSVSLSASFDGNNLEVAVSDTGCGIPADMLDHILDPFVQVQDRIHSSDRAVGTGLGLSICRSMIKVMGGEMSVESEVGKGSTFRIYIPDVKICKDETAAAVKSETSAASGETPKRVLVVDDSPVNRKVLTAFLKKAGVESVDCAGDGVEAFAALDSSEKSGRAHDLVFSDMWMPNASGFELIEKLRGDSRFCDLPVYAVTGDTEARDDARAGLFTGMLLKPLTYGSLLDVISRHGSGRKFPEKS